jgi:multidrug efflux pump subunit AcrA (membrane-fusion protein)
MATRTAEARESRADRATGAHQPRADRSMGVHSPRADAAMPALRLVQPPRAARVLARALMALLVALPIALAFVPWRQSVPGTGRVVAYAPLDRQFNVEAPIYGRVMEWLVAEGSRVKKGQVIARIADNDPEYLDALQSQRTSSEQKLATAASEAKIYGEVTERFREVQSMAVRAARSYIDVAAQKVLAEEQERAAALVARDTDRLQAERLARLLPQGLASRRDCELAEQKYRESAAKFQKAEAALEGARIDKQAKEAYLAEVTAKGQADISKNEGEVQKALGKASEAEKELQDTRVKVRRQQAQEVLAPRDGTILRLLVNQGAEQLKDGDPIAVLVPDAVDLAVELLVDGNDIPLLQGGDAVRLQFEGWPAVQFAGWPSVAVGTFGGRVALVDSTDNGKGKFRILVLPAEGQAWPSGRYLRQGVRAKGWVLLREVRLGYELWRRVNGFPQAVADGEPGVKGGDGEKEKVKAKRPK